jgi:hypothetical protein
VRKFLLFLLLFSGGVALLVWLERRSVPPSPPPQPPPEPVQVPEESPESVLLSGASTVVLYDETTHRAALRVSSEDTRTEGRADVMTGVTLELLDPENESEVQSRLKAEGGRLRRVDGAGGERLHPSWELAVDLTGVQTNVLVGIPLAPLSFQAPTAIVDATKGQRLVRSEDPFTARSTELSFSGRGLFCDLERSLIEIAHGGTVELRAESATPGNFSVTDDGKMQLRRAEGPDEPLVLEAWNGARLELTGADPGELNAEHVTLRALPATDQSGRLILDRLEAEGEVDWRSGESRFQSTAASANFTPLGRLERAHLTGFPRAQLALALASGVVPGAPDPGSANRRDILLSGEESLDIIWRDEGFQLDINGLSSVETSDFRLRSATGVTGWLARDERSARFEAGGGVEVDGGLAALETAHFALAITTDPDGQGRLLGTATGGARLTGTLSGTPARAFTLTTPDALEIERTGAGWQVIESTNVEITLDGPDGFRASLGRLTNLDLQTFTFEAEEKVRFERGADEFGGERLRVLSVQPVPSIELEGTHDAKAYYVGEYGRATALQLRLAGNSVHARGEVLVTVDPGAPGAADGRYDLESDELDLDAQALPEVVPGERLQNLLLQASGNVRGILVHEQRSLVVTGERVVLDWRGRRVAGQEQPLEIGSLMIAEGGVHCDVERAGSLLAVDCDRLEVERTEGELDKGFRQTVASGNVRIRSRGEPIFRGTGDLLTIDADGHGSLQAEAWGRVDFLGTVNGFSARLSADRIDFDLAEERAGHLRASRPEVRIAGLRARAEHLAVEPGQIELAGGVHTYGITSDHVPWTLDADQVSIRGDRDAQPSELADIGGEDLETISANGHVDFRLADRIRARGEHLSRRRTAGGTLRLEGAPCSFETSFARLEADWVEFDPVLQVLVATGQGRLISLVEGPGEESVQDDQGWTLDFLSASTLLELDSLVFVVQEPLFQSRRFGSRVRASWSVMWMNRETVGQEADPLSSLSRAFEKFQAVRGDDVPELLRALQAPELSEVLREVYFEGPVEVLSQGELLARSDALYLDTVSGRGWLAHATVNLQGSIVGSSDESLVVKADWLRLGASGEMRADSATVTSCSFDKPHVKVVTGDLRITPQSGQGREHYRLLLRDNRVELYDKLRIPLPTIDISTDEEFQPLWQTLSLANSARFGTFLSFAFTRPADKAGELFDAAVRGRPKPSREGKPEPPRSRVDAHYKVDGKYLGSRGALLDLGLEIEAKEAYWFDLYVGLVLDDGTDRGLVRVPEEDRGNLRRWLRSQSYFQNGKSELTVSISDQSDPGVQSEFWEGEFVRYERAENYAQWRRTSGENFVDASVKVRLDNFRSDVEELPSLGAYRGRSPILSLGDLALVHTGDLRADYLRRRESAPRDSLGNPDPIFNPFGLPDFFPDGLGDREVLRVDTTQALEVPVPVGAGWRVTPFVEGRATSWSEGVDPDASPTRAVVEGGVRLGTSLWNRAASGLWHVLAPFVELRSELARRDADGAPVVFDGRDIDVSGDEIRVGTRGRLGVDPQRTRLDFEVAGGRGWNYSDASPDGWLPLEVYGRLAPFERPFDVYYDARFDLRNSETEYSLLSIGTRLGEDLGVQAGHQRGRATDRTPLFEAATISGIYRWTEKWEFEGRQAFSLLEAQGLDTRFVIRRYGHDLVFELESSFREGEGSTVGISVRPRFGFRPSRIGYVSW